MEIRLDVTLKLQLKRAVTVVYDPDDPDGLSLIYEGQPLALEDIKEFSLLVDDVVSNSDIAYGQELGHRVNPVDLYKAVMATPTILDRCQPITAWESDLRDNSDGWRDDKLCGRSQIPNHRTCHKGGRSLKKANPAVSGEANNTVGNLKSIAKKVQSRKQKSIKDDDQESKLKKAVDDTAAKLQELRDKKKLIQAEFDREFDKDPVEAFRSKASKDLDDIDEQIKKAKQDSTRSSEALDRYQKTRQEQEGLKQRESAYKEFLNDAESILGKARLRSLDKAIDGSSAKVKKLQADLKTLEAEFNAEFDKDPLNVYKTDIGKRYGAIQGEITKEQRKLSDRAAEEMKKLRDDLLSTGMDRKDAEALAQKTTIQKSALKEASEEEIRAMLADFYQMTGGRGADSMKRIVRTDARAYADKEGALNLGKSTSTEERRETFWHEMGHHIEFERSAISDAAQGWIKSRATGEPKSLNEMMTTYDGKKGMLYDDDEVAYPDKFIDKYVGKTYEDRSTEVIAMGIQSFDTPERMLDLYRKDKEHFLMIVGAMRRAKNPA